MLAKLEREYPNVFAETYYPITINTMPFTIPLIDYYLTLKHRKLYLLS